MSPCSGSKRPLEMVVYDPAAAEEAQQHANKRARRGEAAMSSSAMGAGATMVPYAATPPPSVCDVTPINVVPPPPQPLLAGREEPPCLRRHFLVSMGLRADLPVHFIDDKYLTASDLDPHQNRLRLPSDGVERRLRALLTPRELKRPGKDAAAAASAEGEKQQQQPPGKKIKKPRKTGRVYGGLRVKLVDPSTGAKEMQMSRWESCHGTCTAVKGKGVGYLDFVRRCGFQERDAVEIWAFVQRRFRLFGADVCDDSLLHLLVVKKDRQGSQCRYCGLPHVESRIVSTDLKLAMA